MLKNILLVIIVIVMGCIAIPLLENAINYELDKSYNIGVKYSNMKNGGGYINEP